MSEGSFSDSETSLESIGLQTDAILGTTKRMRQRWKQQFGNENAPAADNQQETKSFSWESLIKSIASIIAAAVFLEEFLAPKPKKCDCDVAMLPKDSPILEK